ncbi:hypothetical protein KO498_11330 [Lentibacter algarum]|uniref:histidine phosphotransferase family protein n=1 Tax=Lentibacter algarum TaxID=576131 RepID=UPI001C097E7C|nr:histidine phosphotransferase family protein [Lentibacter algarum]MBU2982400.1 hypothetical protein [Lentibacter algarum]
MTQDSLTLATLIGSRICHDIISPIGAISNGLELVALTGQADTPEMNLISQSVEGANARVRFYRVALGLASSEQRLGAPEIKNILAGFYADTRMSCDWAVPEDARRDEVQAVLLALLCLGSALASGGVFTVTKDNGVWEISGVGKPRAPEALWSTLKSVSIPDGLQPSEVQFAMLPRCTNALERVLTYTITDESVSIRF